MNNTAAAMLCRYVKAACPQQAFDEYTPTAWADLLTDVRFEDAKEAVRNLGQRTPFIAPAEIITEVKRIRAERIRLGAYPVPPAGLSVLEEAQWVRDAWRRIGDGEQLEDTSRGVLVARDVQAAITAAAQGAVPVYEATRG